MFMMQLVHASVTISIHQPTTNCTIAFFPHISPKSVKKGPAHDSASAVSHVLSQIMSTDWTGDITNDWTG